MILSPFILASRNNDTETNGIYGKTQAYNVKFCMHQSTTRYLDFVRQVCVLISRRLNFRCSLMRLGYPNFPLRDLAEDQY